MDKNNTAAAGENTDKQAPLRVAFGIKLRELRRQRLMSQSRLAETTRVSLNTIGSIERGLRFPSPEVLEALATALGVDVRELFEFGDLGMPGSSEGMARELFQIVNGELIPRIDQLIELAGRLLNRAEVRTVPAASLRSPRPTYETAAGSNGVGRRTN